MSNPAGTLVPREARDFGAYELVAKLATGGMAEIFLARRTDAESRGEMIVIKRILPHLADDEHFVTMFHDEAMLASKLEHPNCCRVYNLGQAQGTHFIVMEYLHGVALSRMLTRLAKNRLFLDLRLVARIVIDACEGLHHAHELRGPDGHLLNVVHRDVSPPNIFLCADGVVKLLDFGIAKARGAGSKTRTGTVKGKNAYMSPEQILGKPLDRRSDVFALGAVLYELLAVKRLFHRDSDFLTFKAITEEPIPDIKDRRPELPPAIREIVHKALARDVNARYPNALAMADAVRRAVEPLGGPASHADLARAIHADFADELATKEQLLQAEAQPGLAVHADSSSVPTLSLASGPPGAPTVVDKKRGNVLEARDGELRTPPRAPGTPPPIPGSAPKIVTSVATEDTMQLPAVQVPLELRATPPAMPAQPFPGAANTVAPLAMVPPTGESMTGAMMATELNTDLLGNRKKRLMVYGIAAGVACALVTLMIVLSSGGGSHKAAAAPPDAAPSPSVVKKPPTPNAADAGVDKNDIKRFSHYGYFSLSADDDTVIYIDNKRVGDVTPDAPLQGFPLDPGPHKVRADGPKHKKKFFDITIYGGKDLEYGMISWKSD